MLSGLTFGGSDSFRHWAKRWRNAESFVADISLVFVCLPVRLYVCLQNLTFSIPFDQGIVFISGKHIPWGRHLQVTSSLTTLWGWPCFTEDPTRGIMFPKVLTYLISNYYVCVNTSQNFSQRILNETSIQFWQPTLIMSYHINHKS